MKRNSLTKGAIGQLAKSTAIDYAPFNINVNCICPGTIETPLYHNAIEEFSKTNQISKDDLYDGLKTAQPIQRVGRPEEVASLVRYLCSEESGFITGSLFSVDGGYCAQ